MPLDSIVPEKYPHICQDILSHLPIPMYWLDSDLRFRGANYSFLKLYNILDATEILGKKADEITWQQQYLSEQQTDILMPLAQQVLCNDIDGSINLTHPSPDGKNTHFQAQLFPLTETLEENGVLVFFENRTESQDAIRNMKLTNKKLEAVTADLMENLDYENQLRLEAEAASVAKSDFLANMSHELRTPLNSILGMTEMLLLSNLNTDQKHCASQAQHSGEQLLVLMNDILDFSKIEAGALDLEYIPFNFVDVIDSVIVMLNPTAQNKDIKLSFDMSDKIGSQLMGDPVRLRQILINLIGNAVKFTEKGSIQVIAKKEDNYLKLDVYDTGIGIKAAKLASIFDKFTQADTSMARKFGGSGLGLAITKQLVLLMNGKINVSSVEGKGSTFSFAIPYIPPTKEDLALSHKKKATTFEATHFEHIPLEDVSLLLVEDDLLNQDVCKRFLTQLGITKVDTANDGQEGVNAYSPEKYNIILMDCQMPHMDGFEATKTLRKNEHKTGKHVPIIAITANALIGDREKCIKAGMDNYISKPIKLNKLQELLSCYIKGMQPIGTAPQQQASSEDTILDSAHLESFTGGNLEDERDLVELFYSQADECLEVLAATVHCRRKEDNENWRCMSHRLKGSSANLGAINLSKACLKAEENKDTLTEEKHAMLSSIKNELSKLKVYMQKRTG